MVIGVLCASPASEEYRADGSLEDRQRVMKSDQFSHELKVDEKQHDAEVDQRERS